MSIVNKKDAVFLYENRSNKSVIYFKTHKIYKVGNIVCKEYKKHEKNRVILNIEISRLLGDIVCSPYLGYFQSNEKYILFYHYLMEDRLYQRRDGLQLIKKFHRMARNIRINDLKITPEQISVLDEVKSRCFSIGESDIRERFSGKYQHHFTDLYSSLFQNTDYTLQIIHGDYKFNNIIGNKIIDFDHVRIGPVEYDIARYLARRDTCSFDLIPTILTTLYPNYDSTLIMKFYLHHTLTFMAQSLGENNISLQKLYNKNIIFALNYLDLYDYINIFYEILFHNKDIGPNVCE